MAESLEICREGRKKRGDRREKRKEERKERRERQKRKKRKKGDPTEKSLCFVADSNWGPRERQRMSLTRTVSGIA